MTGGYIDQTLPNDDVKIFVFWHAGSYTSHMCYCMWSFRYFAMLIVPK